MLLQLSSAKCSGAGGAAESMVGELPSHDLTPALGFCKAERKKTNNGCSLSRAC